MTDPSAGRRPARLWPRRPFKRALPFGDFQDLLETAPACRTEDSSAQQTEGVHEVDFLPSYGILILASLVLQVEVASPSSAT
jgi:hypothetical protein